MIRPGTGNGQPSSSTPSTAITWSAFSCRCRGGSSTSCWRARRRRSPGRRRGRAASASSGTRPVSPRFSVCSTSLGEVPEVQPAAVASGGDVVEVEALLVGVRLSELGRHEHVLARLVPEVVVEGRRVAAVLPAALHLEGLRVEHGEAAGAVSVRVSEHRDDDVVARHAVHCGAVCSRLAYDLLRLDHLLDARLARVVGHVDDVNP